MKHADFEIVHSGIKLVHFSSMTPSPYSMHEHMELLIVRKGPVPVTIDDYEVTLHEGDIAFTPSFSSHKNGATQDVSVDALVFSRSICSGSEKLFDGRHLIRPHLRKEEVPELLHQLILYILSCISGHNENDAPSGKHVTFLDTKDCKDLCPYIAAMLAELNRLLPAEPSKFSDYSVVKQVLRYCSSHFNEDISREQVAGKCGLSANAVSQIFSMLNTSFPQYINNLRLNRAYTYLICTDMSISQVMKQCGYWNQGTFNRNFYTRFQRTPSQVRKLPHVDNIAVISEVQEIVFDEDKTNSARSKGNALG